ncbi:MAG TPA: hypothetical protein VN690_14145 [Terriglobales bacterium]|nr:hypothetical protein [Terriglobales bacterium]
MLELAGSARTDALAALLSQGDPAALAPSLAILGDRSAWAAARLALLPSIAHAPLGPDFLPFLTQLYSSGEASDRRAAISGLIQGGAWALSLLAKALDDPDLGVRHLAVFALGRVTHQPAWSGPPYAPGRRGPDPFVQHEATYIAYWRQWLAQHPQP